MKNRYKLLELRRNRDNLMRYLETYDTMPKKKYDAPRVGLRMDEKLSICAEMTRLQKHIDRIEKIPLGKIDDDCGDFTISIPAKFNPPTTKLPIKLKKTKTIPYTFSTWKLSS